MSVTQTILIIRGAGALTIFHKVCDITILPKIITCMLKTYVLTLFGKNVNIMVVNFSLHFVHICLWSAIDPHVLAMHCST